MKNDLEKLGFLFENINRKICYHITSENSIPEIKKSGLIPRIPKDFEDEEGVYCFVSEVDANDALANWLGERIEEWEENNDKQYKEVMLVLDITGLKYVYDDAVGYEIIVKEVIPPDRILKIERMY